MNYIIPLAYETQNRLINPAINNDIIRALILESLNSQTSPDVSYFFDGDLKLSANQEINIAEVSNSVAEALIQTSIILNKQGVLFMYDLGSPYIEQIYPDLTLF